MSTYIMYNTDIVVVEYRTLEYMVIICFMRYIIDKNTAKCLYMYLTKRVPKFLSIS